MTRPGAVRGADELERAVAAGGLLAPGSPVVVLLSGGRDSVCLLDLAVRLAGPASVRAVHVDYGLRPCADADAALCRRVSERAGVALSVERPDPPAGGNVQDWARQVRYTAAMRIASASGADVAAGHTADDQVETILYRLAASPGRRALLGMPPRSGRVVRPLLELRRAETAAYCRERGLPYADDPSNADPRYARNRARHAVVPAWRTLHPAADENLLRTLEVLRAEADVLDAAVQRALAEVGTPPRVERLAALAPALARLVLQALADAAVGGRAPAIGARAGELLELGSAGGSASLDLPGGLRAEVAYGELRFRTAAPGDDEPGPAVRLRVPGAAAIAGGVVTSERGSFPPGDGVLAADALEPELEVRTWRAGDRMRPLGLGGTKRLQDLFTDAKVPRAQRSRLPVVLSRGEIAWVAGVATAERFKVRDGGGERVRLSWAPPEYD